MTFFKPLDKLCDPAKLYLVISVVSILASLMTSNILGIGVHAVTVLLWAFVLGWICDQGYPGISWFLVLALPVLMLVMMIVGVVFIFTRPENERSEIIGKLGSSKSTVVVEEGDDEKKDEEKDEEKDEKKDEEKDEEKEGYGGYDSSEEGMTGMNTYNKGNLEKMSIRNPSQLGRAVQGMMSMKPDGFTNPSGVSEAFGPIL